MIYMKKENKQN